MSLESMSVGKKEEITKEEAEVLYESLPEEMKTGYYGFAEGQLFSNKQEAGENSLPHVIVAFADGRKISLHLTLKSELSFEGQAQKIIKASEKDKNISKVELLWKKNA